ncbi:Rid family hydrolase [Streptomyces xiaopingdaonensis]|uniref:Rid family hydrolase n=1 Tax=Streptomyces xiaopingdaonensis TaxID=1565415 RepID=UPI0002D8DAF6|nr:Rid family hydrolase [Streptomyces xiaopingdaonensis]
MTSPADSFPERFGAARAVAAGDRVLVGGTLPVEDGVLLGEGDPYEQTRAAFARALSALRAYGLGAEAVVRTRVHLVHERDLDEAARAHRELFAGVRPAATALVVAGLADTRALVEVELEAYRGS